MSELDEFKATYFDECAELLGALEEEFTEIEAGDRSAERLNAVFRAIHSIKGGAGAFGFQRLVAFAHSFETLLDHVRNGEVELTDEVVALCIRSNDLVADFVSAARNGEDLPDDHGADELARFEALYGGEDGEPLEEFDDIEFEPVMVSFDGEPDGSGFDDFFANVPMNDEPSLSGKGITIRFRPHAALYQRANDPLLLLRELATLGDVSVAAEVDELPGLAQFEPFSSYCSWTISLAPKEGVGIEEVREVFEFVEGDCELAFSDEGPASPMAGALADDETLPDAAIGSIVAGTIADTSVADTGSGEAEDDSFDALSFADLAAAIEPAAKAAEPARPEPIETRSAMTPPSAGSTDNGADDKAHAAKPAGGQSIRVDLDKVDRVVNMVGELVIAQSMLTQQMDDHLKARYQELVRGVEVLAQTTRGLQDSVMAIRAQPVKTVFSRLPRLVRELATKTGKKMKLEMVGEQTEIDKTIIEQLSDPLTHMIRNSADHGLESPEKRVAAGKPDTGTITLSAEQAGGNIIIAVQDDGGGINRERVLSLARERGVVGPEQTLTDEQIDELIFAPGFSTADAVSDISGRGVGMDVVVSNIKKIGGSVHVKSWPGKGTRVQLRLPLTLAVLDVMLVKVGGAPYVIPLSSIVETMQTRRAEFGEAPSGRRMLRVRGEYLRVIDLACAFDMPTDTAENERFVVLCENDGRSHVALIVDDIIGQQQVVIKSLEENFQRIDGIAGGTILGDGSVALIVDVQGLNSIPDLRPVAA
ncbi:MAG: chemotaxis protein CheA [Hyphomicrobiaceae bacterium]|nr:chemotaxis protein CheA [Hyphomicrobiaceae bacterium]MCC0023757.1 chemotaxis protein CheA [Hyphomicrobiaceae bacterium]